MMKLDFKNVDPELDYVETFQKGGSVNVHRVVKNGQEYVLKEGLPSYTGWGHEHLSEEVEALRKLEDVDCVVPLETDYGLLNQRRFILKRYIPGDTLESPDFMDGKFIRSFESQLEGNLEEIHAQGFCGFEIKRKNLVYDPLENKIYFIDFGKSKVFEEDYSGLDVAGFFLTCCRDWENLEGIFK